MAIKVGAPLDGSQLDEICSIYKWHWEPGHGSYQRLRDKVSLVLGSSIYFQAEGQRE